MTDVEFGQSIRKSAISNFVINVVINAAIAWLLMKQHAALSAWGDPAYGPDLLITGFLLAAIVSAIGLEVHRRKARAGEMEPRADDSPFVRKAGRRSTLVLCLAFGLAGTVVSLLLALVLATVAGELVTLSYVAIKGIFAGGLAAVLVAPTTRMGLRLGEMERAS